MSADTTGYHDHAILFETLAPVPRRHIIWAVQVIEKELAERLSEILGTTVTGIRTVHEQKKPGPEA